MDAAPTDAALRQLIDLLTGPGAAIVLATARPLGVAAVVPVFTRPQLGVPVQAGFALALAAPGFGRAVEAVAASGAGAGWLGVLGAKEAAVGALIGLLFGLPVWAAQAAGELLDTQRGANQGGQQDPASGGPASPTGALLALVATALFVAVGGLPHLTGAVWASYAAWPLLEPLPDLSRGGPMLFLGLLDGLMRAALDLALPVVLAMVVADVAVMLAARAVSKLNVSDLAPNLRNLVYAFVLTGYVAALCAGLDERLAVAEGTATAAFARLLGGAPP